MRGLKLVQGYLCKSEETVKIPSKKLLGLVSSSVSESEDSCSLSLSESSAVSGSPVLSLSVRGSKAFWGLIPYCGNTLKSLFYVLPYSLEYFVHRGHYFN